ncbi:MAG TPA: hypothetical protein H9710_00175 [Candidatus Acutalibacter pullicola]|uniref:Uncharacterized protein n=1 Tax=Candidatus Acutalibacter pullicola TaxID=2838417 RepID=A0A9D2MTV3_9FIRM|nr:hypothetical protein [Candidatus Acutalibacter pullicola]
MEERGSVFPGYLPGNRKGHGSFSLACPHSLSIGPFGEEVSHSPGFSRKRCALLEGGLTNRQLFEKSWAKLFIRTGTTEKPQTPPLPQARRRHVQSGHG